jgi:hypothetical protein
LPEGGETMRTQRRGLQQPHLPSQAPQEDPRTEQRREGRHRDSAGSGPALAPGAAAAVSA